MIGSDLEGARIIDGERLTARKSIGRRRLRASRHECQQHQEPTRERGSAMLHCASLLFAWTSLERQFEIRGTVSRVGREETEEYFYSRPIGNQIGAWASAQSSVIESRATLEKRVTALMEKYRGQTVPVPPFWGGFRVAPDSIEFWQGRPSRLHDRLRYSRSDNGPWRVERLSP